MLHNDTASAEAFSKLCKSIEKNKKSNVMVSAYTPKFMDDYRFRIAYGLTDVVNNDTNPVADAKEIPFELSFLARFYGKDTIVDCDKNSYDKFQVIKLSRDFFDYMWSLIGFKCTPCIDLFFSHPGVEIKDLTLKELSELPEPRPMNVLYIPESSQCEDICNLGFSPALNGVDTIKYSYSRNSKFTSRNDFSFDSAPLVVLAEIVDTFSNYRQYRHYLVYIPERYICIMSAEEIRDDVNNFFITNGSIYKDVNHSCLIVSSGKPFPVIEADLKDSIYKNKSWVPFKTKIVDDEPSKINENVNIPIEEHYSDDWLYPDFDDYDDVDED